MISLWTMIVYLNCRGEIMFPIIVGGIIGAKSISDIWQADKYEREARSVNYEAYSLIETANRKLKSQSEKTESTLMKLANRKRGIMSSSLPKFIEVYEKIKRIEFEDVDLSDDSKALIIQSENINAINKMISVSGVQLSDKEIIGTYLFSIEYGGLFGAIKKDAKINLDLAYTRSNEAEVIAHNIDTARIAIEAIIAKAERFLKLLAQMNMLFLKSLQYTSELIERNGYNKRNYSVEDKKALMNCMNFAKAVKDILTVPLFDSDGKVSQQVNQALETGNEYINQLQAVK